MSNMTDIIINAAEEPQPLLPAVDMIRKSISGYATGSDRHDIATGLVTFTVPLLPSIDALQWLNSQSIYPRTYWMNREGDDIAAGIGQADSIVYDHQGPNRRSFELLQQHITARQHNARYFGGCCFDNVQQRDPGWKPFKSLYFILPEIQITVTDRENTLSCHLFLDGRTPVNQLCARLMATLEAMQPVVTPSPDCNLPDVTSTSFKPDMKQWIEICNKALEKFQKGFMGKMILARQTTLKFSVPFSPLLFLIKYPFPDSSTYRYYFEPEKNKAFFSFTPERLYRRDHDRLLTEALAGTCSKQALEEDSIDACRHLLNSEKDIREHRFVKDTILKELSPICSTIDMEEEVRALQLNSLVHLYTRCKATLNPESSNDATVLSSLHPTPAVGGVPRDEALQQIIDLEPFSRGWYAGPIGWISRQSSEFAVGIRSARSDGQTVFLYSGAGLVKGSNPASEWQEVDHKIGDMLAIIRQTL
ncbi:MULTISPECIES: isochorismate synthase [Prosthecochloris]|uniref:Isochorismate synthase MenF n=1 Tax=Prosthecochloris aestuarii (strain DSM 271 / SK 413) TaxID=290512 RepID=B4S4J3_PROA2|nr:MULTISPECIES: isochorismate synthase [Prosthecochloris]ACF46889.1 isochorismate synthase [Prosthecochloris aestuarii DSM 271]